MKKRHVSSMIIGILLILSLTSCFSGINVKESDSFKQTSKPSVYGKIVPPEGFEEGEPGTENTIGTYNKGQANITLTRAYIGPEETLEEYVKDSRERYEDDILHFMEFEFVDTEGLKYSGKDKEAIAFEALQNKVLRKFWVVYIINEEYVFEITCHAPKDEFDSYIESFNNAIASFEVFKK